MGEIKGLNDHDYVKLLMRRFLMMRVFDVVIPNYLLNWTFCMVRSKFRMIALYRNPKFQRIKLLVPTPYLSTSSMYGSLSYYTRFLIRM